MFFLVAGLEYEYKAVKYGDQFKPGVVVCSLEIGNMIINRSFPFSIFCRSVPILYVSFVEARYLICILLYNLQSS